MEIREAIDRFRNWPNRGDLPVRSVGGWPVIDTWPHVACAAVQVVGVMDSAQSDDDLRAGLVKWVDARRAIPTSGCSMDNELRRAAHEVLYEALYPRVPGRGRCIVVQPPPSLHHRLHLDRNETRTIEVTPTLARGILDLDDNIRGQELTCPDGCIARFMAKIAAGEWTAADPNPATVPTLSVFDAETFDGDLIPGEFDYRTDPGAHRLQAIVNAGRTVLVEIVAPPQAFERIEQLASEFAATTAETTA
jgi:hypothetical protein